MPTDGDIDYSKFTRAQLEEALERIAASDYPKNYANLIAELQRRPVADISDESPAFVHYVPNTLVGPLLWHGISKMIAVYGGAAVLAGVVAALNASGGILAALLALGFVALIPMMLRGDALCPGCGLRTMELDWALGSKIFYHQCNACGARAMNGVLRSRGSGA